MCLLCHRVGQPFYVIFLQQKKTTSVDILKAKNIHLSNTFGFEFDDPFGVASLMTCRFFLNRSTQTVLNKSFVLHIDLERAAVAMATHTHCEVLGPELGSGIPSYIASSGLHMSSI